MNAEETPRPSPRRQWLGGVAGVATGALLAYGFYLLAETLHGASGMLLLSVLLIPPAACALAVAVSGIRRDKDGNAIVLALCVVTALLLGGAVVLREGAICLAMAAPLFYPLGVLGALAAKVMLRTSGKRMSAALLALVPLLLMPFERQDVYETYNASVVTQVEINAPLETVSRQAVEIRAISRNEQQWTLTQDILRVPRPVDARLVERDGARVREATWAGGIRFDEVVTEWREGERIAWRFVIPEATADLLLDEHLRLDEGYLQMHGGHYDFEALSPNRTRLTLTTRYSARTPVNAYARAWGDLLLGDIHRNVLSIVRDRAEANPS